jgi:hypothetical protein
MKLYQRIGNTYNSSTMVISIAMKVLRGSVRYIPGDVPGIPRLGAA